MEYPLIVNSSSNSSLFHDKPQVVVPYVVILTVAAVGGTFGNLLVFASMLILGAKRHTPVNGYVFIGNLALSDVIVTLVINPFAILGKFVIHTIMLW